MRDEPFEGTPGLDFLKSVDLIFFAGGNSGAAEEGAGATANPLLDKGMPRLGAPTIFATPGSTGARCPALSANFHESTNALGDKNAYSLSRTH